MKKVSKGLIIFCVIVPVISFIIGFCIALNIESKYRTIFSAERSELKLNMMKIINCNKKGRIKLI